MTLIETISRPITSNARSVVAHSKSPRTRDDWEPDDANEDDESIDAAAVDLARKLASDRLSAEKHLAALFLILPGNRATIKLLMRGMPVPATFGFPGTDGTLASNVRAFVCQFHPFISIWLAHPLHPFSRKERCLVFLCSVAFNFFWTNKKTRDDDLLDQQEVEAELSANGEVTYYAVKYLLTLVYAVLIRQLVICPCFYAPLLTDFDLSMDATPQRIITLSNRLRLYKLNGDRTLLVIFVLHFAVIASVVYYTVTETHTNVNNYFFWSQIIYSEAINFLLWFVKFAPLFAFLYPIHRAAWFQDAKHSDYLYCKRSVRTYVNSDNFRNEHFPRCVEPENMKVHSIQLTSLFSGLIRGGELNGLSTFASDREIEAELAKSHAQPPAGAASVPNPVHMMV